MGRAPSSNSNLRVRTHERGYCVVFERKRLFFNLNPFNNKLFAEDPSPKEGAILGYPGPLRGPEVPVNVWEVQFHNYPPSTVFRRGDGTVPPSYHPGLIY